MNSKKGLFIESSPVTSVHVSAVLHYNSCQVGSMPHWFLSILKQGKNLNEGLVDDSSTMYFCRRLHCFNRGLRHSLL